MQSGCRGLYSKGSKQGDGVYVFASSDTYAGQFSRDKMHGVGVYSFAGSGAYEGEVGQLTASSERVHDASARSGLPDCGALQPQASAACTHIQSKVDRPAGCIATQRQAVTR